MAADWPVHAGLARGHVAPGHWALNKKALAAMGELFSEWR
jgi:hypothetical protein